MVKKAQMTRQADPMRKRTRRRTAKMMNKTQRMRRMTKTMTRMTITTTMTIALNLKSVSAGSTKWTATQPQTYSAILSAGSKTSPSYRAAAGCPGCGTKRSSSPCTSSMGGRTLSFDGDAFPVDQAHAQAAADARNTAEGLKHKVYACSISEEDDSPAMQGLRDRLAAAVTVDEE